MNCSNWLLYLSMVCAAVAGGCLRADNPPVSGQQLRVARAPPVRTTVVAASTENDAVRLASYAPPEHNEVARRIEPPSSQLGSEAYQTLAQAAEAYQTRLSVIANNLANAETTAFKRSRVILEDLAYRHEKMPGAEDTAGQYAPTGISVGMGVRVAGVQTDFTQGAFQQTGGQLDVAIEGAGIFQVMDPSGETLYTRAGNFSKNANGDLVIGSANIGRLLEPPVTIPEDATHILISAEGIVSVRQPGTQALSEVGRIGLANFVNPEGLLKRGENLYAETDASGAPTLANPGQDGIGLLRQGMLEASNVQPDQELIEWRETAGKLRAIRRLLQVE